MIILDCDLIVHTDYFAYGINKILETELNWLMRNIERVLAARKEELRSKCYGAVNHDPRVFWISMIPRPYVKKPPNTVFQQYSQPKGRNSMIR